jgi:tetratricopeptide (TPR) repeat protein
VLKRDDALSREIGLKVWAGKHDEAIQLMTGRKFSVWEGGTLDVADHWVNAHLLRGQQKLQARQFAAALADFQAAKTIPDNLPSDQRRSSGRDAEISYLIGAAHEGLGDLVKAKPSWQEAAGSPQSVGRGRGRGADGGSFVANRGVQRYYQALALRKLGETDRANAIFRELTNAGSDSPTDSGSADASSAPGRPNQRSRLAAVHYAAGLGRLGLGETEQAKAEFKQALAASPDHPGARASLERLASGR